MGKSTSHFSSLRRQYKIKMINTLGKNANIKHSFVRQSQKHSKLALFFFFFLLDWGLIPDHLVSQFSSKFSIFSKN